MTVSGSSRRLRSHSGETRGFMTTSLTGRVGRLVRRALILAEVVDREGADVFVVHAELSAVCGMEAKESCGRALSPEKPVVWLHDDDGELIDEGTVAVEEGLFGALDIDFEDEGGLIGFDLFSEQVTEAEHRDFGASSIGAGAIGPATAPHVDEV